MHGKLHTHESIVFLNIMQLWSSVFINGNIMNNLLTVESVFHMQFYYT
jgi:hypothetical protein